MLKIDGEVILFLECVMYKGMLFSGVFNFVIVVGYIVLLWILKIGFLCEYFM